MNFHVGTSGFSYKEWKGSFYPKDLPAKRMLNYYGERFDAVEINSSFYTMPKATSLEAWAAEVPADFKFVLKGPQRITHFKRLKETEEPVGQFLEVAKVLGDRLGALLFQLPPNMKKDLPRLRDFLALLPRSSAPKKRDKAPTRTAFEFRHASWFDDEVYDVLRERNVALCLAEAEESVEVPFVSTADFGYVRLRLPDYTDTQLKAWLKQIRKEEWADAYVFFKHEDEGKGPKMAARFLKLAR